ncbi:hypothetical protein H312_03020 [Anncaliia algerae PRA339]|uniref:Uncharacterized protein n=1 Tax=Anncaliia algerae PRA339 TaxID=1288291 RepID=A0A059EXG3_9MICR|nr:hypothetical protein H312_03020 [Anncaliia algerae PRA339]
MNQYIYLMITNILPMFIDYVILFIAYKKEISCESNNNRRNPDIFKSKISKNNESKESPYLTEINNSNINDLNNDKILPYHESFTDTEDGLTSSSDSFDEYTYESSTILNESKLSLDGIFSKRPLSKSDKSSSTINNNSIAGKKTKKLKSGSDKKK